MEPRTKSDRILEEWNAVTDTARRPVRAPHPSPDRGPGSILGLVGAGLLAAALVVAVAWLGGRTSTGVGSDPSPSGSDTAVVESASPSAPAESPSASLEPSVAPSATPEPTPTPTPSPTPVPTVGPCAAADLSARITSWEGAAGSRIANVTVKNDGSAPCILPDDPSPSLVDHAGTVFAHDPNHPKVAAVELGAGKTTTTLVEVGNVCKTGPVAPVTLSFQLAGGDLVADPASPTDTTLPPCNGPGQPAVILMKPWGS
jgi:uncharacterized protein DUF4232